MRIDINSLDIEQNFWSLYPEFKAVEPFKSLYTKDKGKKEESSKVMWFVALCYHPTSSLSKLPKDGKDGSYSIVSEDYMEDSGFVKKQGKVLDTLIPRFQDICLTPMERQLAMFEAKLNEREGFLRDTPYDVTNWDKLDKALAGTASINTTYKTLLTKLSQESEGGTTWGDQEESATERGDI
ncbi:hypothetical protein Q5H92_14695 [Hymenobacter sp. M29]|uniref:Uncharacterized protein n=1 Tax=Hymenobacter mellowenesis TaxID=3063995 RepID=A0ABT9ACS3_9BACT|nr:hypothetical protein [Hymenobacter sp. M29]MDO7847614.1 hypothetical protein [Hymenobacter sp. M29]